MLQTIADKLPELRKLEDQVAELEAEQVEAQNRVLNLNTKMIEAQEADLDCSAKALNAGRKPPPEQAPKLHAQFEDAQGELALLQRRHMLATSERSRYVSEHRDQILQLLVEERDAQSTLVAQAATEALDHLLRVFAVEDEGRHLERTYPGEPAEPPPPLKEYSGTHIIGMTPLLTTQNIRGGPQRGELEGTLRYLISLASEAETVVESGDVTDEDEPAAALGHDPEDEGQNGVGAA